MRRTARERMETAYKNAHQCYKNIMGTPYIDGWGWHDNISSFHAQKLNTHSRMACVYYIGRIEALREMMAEEE